MIEGKVTCICAGSHDDGQIVGLGKASMEHDVVVHVLYGVVADEPHEADLVVDNKQRNVVPINPLEFVCGD